MRASTLIRTLEACPLRQPRVRSAGLALSLWLAAFFPLAARAEITADARPMIEHFVQAIGGRAAVEAIHSIHVRNSVTTMGLSGSQELWRSMPDRGRENTVIGPYRLSAGVDGAKGWRIGTDGKLSRLDGAELEDARAGTYFDNWGWLASDQGGGRVTFAGPKQDSTGSYLVLEVSPPVGKPRSLWFDRATGLLARTVETGNQPVVIEDYSDYRAVEGVRFPTRTVVRIVGMSANTITSTTDSTWINPPMPAEIFAAPEGKSSSIRYVQAPGRAEVAFRYDFHLIWVRASINGGPPADFLFDTGASTTVVDSAYAARIGLATVGRGEIQGAGAVGHVSLANLGSVHIGEGGDGAELGSRTAAVIPISASLGPALWHDVAGILGYDVIHEFAVTVDYDQQRLTLDDPTTFHYAGSGRGLPFTLAGGMPVVPMELNDQMEGNFKIDLGNAGGVVLEASFASAHGIRPERAVTAAGSGFGGRYPVQNFRMNSLTLGPLRWEDPIISLATASAGALADENFAGLIGNQVLERFRCTLDYAHGVLYLEPGARADDHDRFTRVGLMLARTGDVARATQVLGGSPAERAGVRVGDVVLTIDGKSVSLWGPDRLQKRFESTDDTNDVVFGLRRAGKNCMVVVHKKTLL